MDFNVVSFDGNNINDGTNYESGFVDGSIWGLPSINPRLIMREGVWPLVSGVNRGERIVTIGIHIVASANLRTRRDELMRWFDPENEDPKQLVIEDDDGSNDRYVECICRELRPVKAGENAVDRMFIATLVVHGDVRWRSISETSDTWNITSSGETNVIANSGSDDAYPTFEITPTTAKSGTPPYKRWVTINYRAPEAAQYPVRIGPIDTRTASTNFTQADGSDIRIFVDGVEFNRHLVDPNTANTYIWVTMNFEEARTADLEVAIPSSGVISSIQCSDDISAYPSSGILLIDNEEFYYTSKDNISQQFTGITRAVRGSSMASHTVGDTVYWIQRDVVMGYGQTSPPDAKESDISEPIFELDQSTNTSWYYARFGKVDSDGQHRYWPQSTWLPNPLPDWCGVPNTGPDYGTYVSDGSCIAAGDNYTIAGMYRVGSVAIISNTRWSLYNPCGIVNAEWCQNSDGVMSRGGQNFRLTMRYLIRGGSWVFQRVIEESDLAAVDTEYSWTENKEASDWEPASWLTLELWWYEGYAHATDCKVYLDSTATPDVSISSETSNYRLKMTIENTTIGESITIELDTTLNDTTTVNCDDHTVEEGGAYRSGALTVEEGVRRHWLRLQPGNNTLTVTESGLVAVTVVTKFEARFY